MTLNEKKIWKQFKKGDKKALNIIFETYYESLYNYGIKICTDKNLIRDSIQDFFLKLWIKRENLRDLDFLKSYLFFSFRRNLYYNLTSFNKLRFNDDSKEADFGIEFSHEDFLVLRQETIDQKERVINALNQLPERQREIIYLRYFEDFKVDHIAEVLQINEQSVRNRLHAAISKLREIL
jgi:RNA polymerase sigma factor (sigma-70 family)